MEDNEKNLAQDMKKEAIEKYKRVNLELKMSKGILPANIKEEQRTKVNEQGEEYDTIEYDVYIPFTRENGEVEFIKIATIDDQGIFNKNREILKDSRYTDEEKEALEKIIDSIGLDHDEVDLNKMQEQLEKTEAKTKEQLEQEKDAKEEETTKDDNDKESERDEKEDKEERIEEKSDEEEKNEIATKKNIPAKNIFILRRDSQFYKNYPQVPKTTYFYRDNDGKIKAEYIDENGRTQPSEFFNDSTTNLKEQVIGLRDDGEPVKEEIPYQVMTTKGLRNTNRNARDIRIAIYIENGYMEFEEVRQGDNGKWTGYGLEGKGRDYNSKVVNELSNTKTNSVEPEEVSNRYEAVENTGLADDGVQMQDLSPMKTIERFMEEGYQKQESIDIYNYMIGEEHLSEEAAKERVNEEIVERIENEEREVEDDEKTPWGDAWERRNRR